MPTLEEKDMSASKWIGRSRGVFAGCLVTLLWALQPGFAAELDASGGPSGNRWVTTWSAAQMQPGPLTIDSLIFGNDQSRSFENQTIRHIVHASVGGKRVRVRLSNAFGFLPLRVGAASVALRLLNHPSIRARTGGSRSAARRRSWFPPEPSR